MNNEFLSSQCQHCCYALKKGTASSYYRQSGCTILPERIGMVQGIDIPKTNGSGRMTGRKLVGKIQAKFKVCEESVYKQNKPYRISTSLWQHPDYPQFFGWGTIGISGVDGVINMSSETWDLIVLYAPNGLEQLDIYIFPAMGKDPDTLNEAMAYLCELVS